MKDLQEFKLFLQTAPVNWSQNDLLKRFQLPNGESVSCVLWNELFHITGTDIVKALVYRFELLGRTVVSQKKFEEGIFSDLRNLKPQQDATLEESRSDFLKFLYENQCIRTQKKQKVFYWFSVKHDKLFLDALERDLKREAAGQQPCTVSKIHGSPNHAMELARSQCLSDKPFMFDSGYPERFDTSLVSSPHLGTPIIGSPSQSHVVSSPQNHLMSSPQNHMSSNSPNHMILSPPQTNVMTDYSIYEPRQSPLNPARLKPSQDVRAAPYSIRRNSSDKQFACTHCAKVFKRHEHLKRHMRCHTGEKPFFCRVADCGRSFSRSDHLAQHVRSHGEQWGEQWNETSWNNLGSDIDSRSDLGKNESRNLDLHSNGFTTEFEFDDLSMHNQPPTFLKHESRHGTPFEGELDDLMGDLLGLDPEMREFPEQRLLSY